MNKTVFTGCFLAVAMTLMYCGVATAREKVESVSNAASQEKSVAQELLDILRSNNQITAEQYDTLLTKTKAEESKWQKDGKGTPGALQVFWKDGLNFAGGDDAPFKFQIGGYIQTDWAYTNGDKKLEAKFGKSASGTQLRRARLALAGSLYDTTEYKIEYDFSGGTVKIQDAYFQFNNLPWVGMARVGHVKEPFALTEVTSDKYETFIESATLKEAFIPVRNMGIAIQNHAFDKHMTWAIGGFRETDDVGKGFDSNSQYNLTMRVTGTPWYEEQGRKLVHLGLSYSHKFRNNDPIRFKARPEANLAPTFADSGNIISDGVDLLNPELAVVYGPFAFQTEYTSAMVARPKAKGLNFSGYYMEASYFLTGENRQYKNTAGFFGAVAPKHSFDGQGNWGAWEIATRYSSLDLNDRTIRGGKLSGFTSGVNWYLNPNMRVMANYNLAHRNTFGDTSIFQVRAQLLF